MYRYRLILVLYLAAMSSAVCAAEFVYVSSKQTSLFKEANLNADLITTLQQNDKAEVMDERGVWVLIKVDGKSGWVSRYAVSSEKPFEQKVSVFGRLKNFFREDNKRARVTLVSTAGGVRGLTEAESDAIGKTDFEAVKIMEAVEISEPELDTFIAGISD